MDGVPSALIALGHVIVCVVLVPLSAMTTHIMASRAAPLVMGRLSVARLTGACVAGYALSLVPYALANASIRLSPDYASPRYIKQNMAKNSGSCAVRPQIPAESEDKFV